MLKKLLIALAVVLVIIAVLVGVVAMQPSDYRVSRSATMAAPPDQVFAQVNDFHNWQEWSPWAKLDPDCKYAFEGAESGKGAIFTWAGNDKVGEGKMTILDTHPSDRIDITLEFIKPFADTCATEFTFQPKADQTEVSWTMSGKNNFIGKAFCLCMNMDKMIGGDFEKGLASMKEIVEKGEKAPDKAEETK